VNEKIVLPKYDDLFKPTLEALATLGGSGSNEEIDETVMVAIGATQQHLDIMSPKRGVPTLLNRMAWARTYLKTASLTGNPKRGVWVLTEEGRAASQRTNSEIKRIVTSAQRSSEMPAKADSSTDIGKSDQENKEETTAWSDQLLARMQAIPPDAFERLCQRLLRESGFTRVEVSGKSGDGGIDGAGVLRVNLISFQVLFQCKRWKGSVGSEVVRNFRGAMQGRADKGLIITTGSFTSEARKEATRDGAPAIDLIDGEALCDLMKDLGLGVRVREVRVEEISLDEDFFAAV
jgi:restriction system protein